MCRVSTTAGTSDMETDMPFEAGNIQERRPGSIPSVMAVLALMVTGIATANVYNVRDYGAVGNGTTLDSPAVNAAIDACHTVGGGTVHFPPGIYLSGSIRRPQPVGRLPGLGAQPLGIQFDLGDRPDKHRDLGSRHD